jgi:hypothetical protein
MKSPAHAGLFSSPGYTRTMTDARRVILDLLDERGAGKTICPSEAARALAADWRPLMDDVRATAFAMADRGEIEVTQKGDIVDGPSARGPIRLRLPS